MKTTLEILENEIHWKINSVQEGEDYDGRIHYVMALEGVLRQIKGLKDEEKRLISEAYRIGVEEDVYNNPLKTGEQYFNETFKKTEQ